MPVIMISEAPGADANFIDGMSNAGVLEAMASCPGFISHIRGAASTGYRVIEVWESREAHEAWVANVILPNMPPGAPPPTTEYIDLLATVPGS